MPIQLLAGIYPPNVVQQFAAVIFIRNLSESTCKISTIFMILNLKRGSNVRP